MKVAVPHDKRRPDLFDQGTAYLVAVTNRVAALEEFVMRIANCHPRKIVPKGVRNQARELMGLEKE